MVCSKYNCDSTDLICQQSQKRRLRSVLFDITVTAAQTSKFQSNFFLILILQTSFVDLNSALMMFSSLLIFIYTSSPQQAVLYIFILNLLPGLNNT